MITYHTAYCYLLLFLTHAATFVRRQMESYLRSKSTDEAVGAAVGLTLKSVSEVVRVIVFFSSSKCIAFVYSYFILFLVLVLLLENYYFVSCRWTHSIY